MTVSYPLNLKIEIGNTKDKKTMTIKAVMILIVSAKGVECTPSATVQNKSRGQIILLKDSGGAYIRIKGELSDKSTSLINACERYNIPLKTSQGSFSGLMCNIFSYVMIDLEEGVWSFWRQYSHVDGCWNFNSKYINPLKPLNYRCSLLCG